MSPSDRPSVEEVMGLAKAAFSTGGGRSVMENAIARNALRAAVASLEKPPENKTLSVEKAPPGVADYEALLRGAAPLRKLEPLKVAVWLTENGIASRLQAMTMGAAFCSTFGVPEQSVRALADLMKAWYDDALGTETMHGHTFALDCDECRMGLAAHLLRHLKGAAHE